MKHAWHILLFSCTIQSLVAQNITIVGSGYVGLTMAGIFSAADHQVTCYDIDTQKIKNLRQSICPIFEPGLSELIFNKSNPITYTTNITDACNADIIFLCVPTPSHDDGSCDLTYVHAALDALFEHIPNNTEKTICIKSTVAPGSLALIQDYLNIQKADHIHLLYNPEFMREGSAINDIYTQNPVVIGGQNKTDINTLQQLYDTVHTSPQVQKIHTNYATAEIIKYAWNSFLALRIAYINELASLCNTLGGDIDAIKQALAGTEEVLPAARLQPGPGYGGSCFPKDTRGFASLLASHGYNQTLVHQTIQSNVAHKKRLVDAIFNLLGDPTDKTIAILGLSFKANTNDIRMSPAIDLIKACQQHTMTIKAYDPQAMPNMQQLFANVVYTEDAYQAARNADCVVVLTEWQEFKDLDIARLAQLIKQRILVDSRNLYDPSILQQYGFTYYNMGKL